MSKHASAEIFDFRTEESRGKLLSWKRKAIAAGKTIVFTNGVFDILHRGHVEYLSKAGLLGDLLVVGLNTDESVRRLKGSNRPIQAEEDRAIILGSLKCIDAVVYFNEDTPVELITFLLPNILTKGADYRIGDIAGSEVVLANGGDVLTIDLTEGRSTSSAIETIINRYEKR
jgi:D-glycero-beta-D-manno-heptose 1-phosphate adenylyltransferase